MTTADDRSLLSRRDPAWVGLGLALLIFAALIVVEISLVPTYVDVKIEVDGFATEWFEPQRMSLRLQNRDGWPVRYFVSQRTAEICPLEPGVGLEFEAALQDWADDNNWEIVNPSLAYSCLDYASLGLDVGESLSGLITLKPLGWDEGLEWNATLCLVVTQGDPCGQMTLASIVPSFWVMVRKR